jgi:hypothetical protein
MSRSLLLLLAVGLAATGCGGTSQKSAQSTRPTSASVAPTTPSTTSAGGLGALQAEANSAAAGDIPDNQVFLVFNDAPAGYSMKYPEGWAQRGSGRTVVFRDKNNIVRVVVGSGTAPTKAAVAADLRRLKGARIVGSPQPIVLPGGRAVKVVYSTESAPNAVTGKRVTLMVDRYYVSNGHRRAVVDLGTPQGVDNVDAYRLMIQSFRWR